MRIDKKIPEKESANVHCNMHRFIQLIPINNQFQLLYPAAFNNLSVIIIYLYTASVQISTLYGNKTQVI